MKQVYLLLALALLSTSCTNTNTAIKEKDKYENLPVRERIISRSIDYWQNGLYYRNDSNYKLVNAVIDTIYTTAGDSLYHKLSVLLSSYKKDIIEGKAFNDNIESEIIAYRSVPKHTQDSIVKLAQQKINLDSCNNLIDSVSKVMAKREYKKLTGYSVLLYVKETNKFTNKIIYVYRVTIDSTYHPIYCTVQSIPTLKIGVHLEKPMWR